MGKCCLHASSFIFDRIIIKVAGWLVGWLGWGLTSQSTIFQSCRDGAIASWVINQYFRGVKCLAQGHNTAAVGLEPRTSRSGVRHSTTEPPRSPKVAGNQNRHKSSDEFDFGPDQTTHFGVTCPLVTKILRFRTWISLRPVAHYWSDIRDFNGHLPYPFQNPISNFYLSLEAGKSSTDSVILRKLTNVEIIFRAWTKSLKRTKLYFDD